MPKKNILIYSFILVSFSFFFINRIFYSSNVLEKTGSIFLYPIIMTQRKIINPIYNHFQKRKNLNELQLLLEKEKKEKKELLEENIKIKATLDYKKEISEITEFKNRYKFEDKMLAQVIFKMFDDNVHFILVDVGSSKGIKKDMVAIYKNCLLGKVIKTYPYYSKILLITDKNCKVSGYCNFTKTKGVHEGLNSTKETILNYVPHYENLREGDLILSSGEGLIFPKGFALGKIKSFKKQNVTYKVIVEPLTDIKEIENCYLVQKGN